MINMQNIKTTLASLGIILGFTLTSCQQVIDLELETAARQLVVEGRVEKARVGTIPEQVVRLTQVSDFFLNQVDLLIDQIA